MFLTFPSIDLCVAKAPELVGSGRRGGWGTAKAAKLVGARGGRLLRLPEAGLLLRHRHRASARAIAIARARAIAIAAARTTVIAAIRATDIAARL